MGAAPVARRETLGGGVTVPAVTFHRFSPYVALGEPLGDVSYHVHQLEKAGLIELVAVKQQSGALEHYYTPA